MSKPKHIQELIDTVDRLRLDAHRFRLGLVQLRLTEIWVDLVKWSYQENLRPQIVREAELVIRDAKVEIDLKWAEYGAGIWGR